MNEISINIQLKSNFVFPDCYVGQFCELILNLLETYEIDKDSIYDLRMKQSVDFSHTPFICSGRCNKDAFEKLSRYRHPSQCNLSSSNPKDV